jgi:hypothetical protein
MYPYSTHSRRYRVVATLLTFIVALALIFAPLGGALSTFAEESTPDAGPSTEQLTVIETNDAEVRSDTESIVNFNETSFNDSDTPTGTALPDTETGEHIDIESEISNTPNAETPETDAFESPEDASADTPEIPGDSVTTENTGVVANTATSTAETGTNSALGEESVIVTGDAIAYANIVNIVNTNIFNSDGAIGFFNEVLGIEPLDLRSAFDVLTDTSAVSTPPCSPSVCNAEYTVHTDNTATITNDIVVRADTGGNTTSSDGIIYTGDAYAAANIFNLANTNITDSNYLIISFNNFGDYGGDIVLPGADALNALFSANGNALTSTLSSTNSATIENTLITSADTGDNASEGGVITTGDAISDSSIHNIINTNLFGGNDFLLVLRVHGDWNGEIFGLPDGISWAETEHGIMLYNTDSHDSGIAQGATLNATNTATIQNNVSVFALTGANKVGGEGVIHTGDAYAAANITNVANTNILGQNWALLVFDIFGNWSGDLAFGRPDLWIGGSVSSPKATIMPGSEVLYTYTVTNNGDSTATDVHVDHHFNAHELVYASDAEKVQYMSDGAHGTWSLGTLAPNETKEIHFRTQVNTELDGGKREIVSSATVHAHETDADTLDNTEFLSFTSGKNGGGSKPSAPAAVTLTKTSNVDAVAPGDSVDYTITLTNGGGPLYKSILRDVLRNEAGATTSVQYWDLGTIHAGETISVTYTMEFADDATFGTYTNSADVVGLSGRSSLRSGKSYDSPDATDTVSIGDMVPRVLGVSTTQCTPYLTSYMQYGAHNDADDVRRLQAFLNTHMHAALDITGIFDLNTEIVVREFQTRYAHDILNPWGLLQDSGHVYYTTQKKINEIQCNNEIMFPLSVAQYREMSWFKTFTTRGESTVAYISPSNVVYASDDTSATTNAPDGNRSVAAYTPTLSRTQTTTQESRDFSLIEALFLPFKHVFEWSKREYLHNWF